MKFPSSYHPEKPHRYEVACIIIKNIRFIRLLVSRPVLDQLPSPRKPTTLKSVLTLLSSLIPRIMLFNLFSSADPTNRSRTRSLHVSVHTSQVFLDSFSYACSLSLQFILHGLQTNHVLCVNLPAIDQKYGYKPV